MFQTKSFFSICLKPSIPKSLEAISDNTGTSRMIRVPERLALMARMYASLTSDTFLLSCKRPQGELFLRAVPPCCAWDENTARTRRKNFNYPSDHAKRIINIDIQCLKE
ncbi:hypothetical protein AVEN_140657-1 [Araneus ventricosus]|uniref:Uncharacterized protein n=1 Tax=Araneus ventricosus TaxID=182803 RepID=A0A4Y2C6B7_ARAVE|nr:hypothetical protein AVEN_140657-1 [Araneus ventricosus]